MPSLGGKGPTARHISLPVARLPTPLRISPSPKRGGVTQAQWDEYPQLQMLPVLITKNIRPTLVNGGTNIFRYKDWQHLKLWIFVPLRLRDTPPFRRRGDAEMGR